MPVFSFTTLDDPLAIWTFANGINNSGQIVGYYLVNGVASDGFIFTGGLFAPIDDPLASPSFPTTKVNGINAAGQLVGNYIDGTTAVSHGFLRANGLYTPLDDPLATIGTFPAGINNATQIVGSYIDPAGFHGFLLNNGNYFPLDDPLATNGTEAFGINDAGQIVGTYDTATATHAFLFSGGRFTTIDDPLGVRGTFAYGINNSGQIVGSYVDINSISHGFLYNGTSYITIDDPLATGGTVVQGINDAGQVVGYYIANGVRHGFVETNTPNPPPPAGTTANMILRGSNASPVAGQYEIYDIGNNTILAGYQLGQVGTDWQFAGLGGFLGSDTADMLLRNSGTGGFEVYDISNNLITNAAFMGTVGLNWQVAGFGNFSSLGETDMILRSISVDGSITRFEVYDISNNRITNAAFLGAVGLNWRVGAFGDFSSNPGETDMILRNMATGGLEVNDISNNQITGAVFLGTVGLEWQIAGVGNFSGVPGETDMMMMNMDVTGSITRFEIYNISNNQITGATFLGAVGLDWQFAGIAPIHARGASDFVLRNVNTGAFEVYNITNNQLTGAAPLGAVGLDWQLGGFAADPPTGSMGSLDGSTSQLVQAMAGFGGGTGAAESLNTAPLGADTSQQPLLTTPQHA